MLANGGRLLIGAIVLWILATFGIDFLASSRPGDGGIIANGDNKDLSPDFSQFPTQPPNQQQSNQFPNNFPSQYPTSNQYPYQSNYPANQPTQPQQNQPAQPQYTNADFNRTQESLAIGTFNIQVFGVSKISDPNVVAILADIARKFDVLAIQEVRSVDERVIPYFVDVINQNGARYAHVIGPRLGRTSSKEQYVYIYDTDRIELINAGYIMQDANDRIHREPMVSRFRSKPQNGLMPFSFTLMNIHTDPDDAEFEVDALADFVALERQLNPGEDDVILLGDLNASPDQFGRLGQTYGVAVAIPQNVATNTRGNKNYDNIVFDQYMTGEFQSSGVIDLVRKYNLTLDQALQVSDHLPVWGIFSMNEQITSPMASRIGNLR